MIPQLAPFGLGRAMQLGFVVDDLEAALDSWTRIVRIGPFLRPRGEQQVDAVYRGERTAPRLKVAWAFSGETQIALIEQTNDAPSPYRDVRGLEHIGFWVGDADAAAAALEGQGLSLCYEIHLPGDVIRYFDPPPGLDTRISLLRQTPARARLYAELERWAERWDGSDPVRAEIDYETERSPS
jgi:catechol 2,3-dioxygenase-like lactoylglutathione lyase family enzyme